MTEDSIRRIVWRCIWMARGEAPVEGDYAYWVPLWPGLVARGVEINHPNYAEDRVLGWQAGGADVARFGPYSISMLPYHDVPPYPGDVVPPVVDPPLNPPAPGDWLLLEQQIAALRIDVGHLVDVITILANKPTPTPKAPLYEGSVSARWPIGTIKITLTPQA